MTDKNDFLPENYTVPSSSDGYMKLTQGENRFRVLSSAIMGSETWIEEGNSRKPKRWPFGVSVPVEEIGDDGVKHFWAFVVWNYNAKKVQILEITQKGIMRSIRAMTKDEDWGDPKKYDIVINREGEGKATEYTVSPKPHKELDGAIKRHYEELTINLEALYEGLDPFAEASKKVEDDIPADFDKDIPFN